MGRGSQAQTQQMIDQQLAQQSAMNQQLYSSGQALSSQAASGYQNLIANPGYTDAEKSSIANLSQSRAVVGLQRAGAKRLYAIGAHSQFRRLRRADRFARAHARSGPGQPVAAESNCLRQRRQAGHAFRALRIIRPLRHQHEPAWPRAGHSRVTARRLRAQRAGQQQLSIVAGFRPRTHPRWVAVFPAGRIKVFQQFRSKKIFFCFDSLLQGNPRRTG